MTRAVDVASLPPTLIQSGGNVGIGTANPAYKLHVAGTNSVAIRIGVENASAAGTAEFIAYNSGAAGTPYTQFYQGPSVGGITSTTPIIFTNAGVERMRIDLLGNVGIGTSSINKKLVVSNAGAAEIGLDPFGRSGETASSILSYNRATSAYIPLHYDGSVHQFYVSGTERVRIDASGQVGIGTPSPIGLFQVSGANDTLMYFTNTSGAIRLRPYITSVAYSQISATNAAGTAYTPLSIGGSVTIFEVNGAERGRFSSNGTFCINTTAPYAGSFSSFNSGTAGAWPIETLGVDRGIVSRMTSNAGFAAYYETNNGTNVAGNIYVAGTTTTYATSSDYRLKENIQPMQNALEKVALLNPVTYTWKHDHSDGQGFIAHELQEVVPQAVIGKKDAVDENGNPLYQGVDASFLVATLTKAIQELTAKVESLEKEISVLKSI